MPSSSWNKFNQFTEDVAHGVHNLGSHTFKYALCAAANAPVATNSILGNLTQISYTNVTDDGPGSRAITRTSSSQSSGTYSLVLADITITASGGNIAAFRYFVIFNDTPTSPADPLIAWLDYGSDLTIATGESLLVDFPATLFTIGP